jgi:1-aminocyclopropane-1-carboxylate deaminase
VRQITLSATSAPLQPVHDAVLDAHGVRLSVLRLDLLHPFISGNKWFKLRPVLEKARAQGQRTLLSFGGAWSNHLLALAAAGQQDAFTTIGLVRGEVLRPLNPVLEAAEACGMQLLPVSRTDYRARHTQAFLQAVQERWPQAFIIPEGGASLEGVLGCQEIAGALRWTGPATSPRRVTLATATGTTLAGLVSALDESVRVEATLVLKGEDRLSDQVRQWLALLPAGPRARWQIVPGWHAGGYARRCPELDAFITGFVGRTGIPLEPVYTGKMMWSVYGRMASGEIPSGSEVIAIHTGGISPPST